MAVGGGEQSLSQKEETELPQEKNVRRMVDGRILMGRIRIRMVTTSLRLGLFVVVRKPRWLGLRIRLL